MTLLRIPGLSPAESCRELDARLSLVIEAGERLYRAAREASAPTSPESEGRSWGELEDASRAWLELRVQLAAGRLVVPLERGSR